MELEEFFSPEGGLSLAMPLFKYREGQVRMAQAVAEALDEGRPLAVEAGTGIGKSFAYLVPAFLSADKEKWRFVVATSTITLQKQLYDKDIPLLLNAMGKDIPVCVLYGRANYLCLRKYREEEDLLTAETEAPLAKWIQSTKSGAFPDLPGTVKDSEVSKYRSNSRECLGTRCPYYQDCFYYRSRRKAEKSRLIVTNHHLLLLDAKARFDNDESFSEKAVLPSYDIALVDEAHHINDEVTEVLSRRYSSMTIYESATLITRKELRFGGASLLDFLTIEEKVNGTGRIVKEELEVLKKEAADFDKVLFDFFSALKTKGADASCLMTPAIHSASGEVFAKGKGIVASSAKLLLLVREGYSWDAPKYPQFLETLSKVIGDIASQAEVLETWRGFSAWDKEIPYLCVEDWKAKRIGLRIAPMTTGKRVAEMLSDKLRCVVYCSATLTVNNDFRYFLSQTGLEEDGADTLLIPSPFDYKRNLLLLIPVDGRMYDNQNVEDYEGYLSRTIAGALEASGGGALVLFTSRKTMRAVHQAVKDKVQGLLMQDEMSKGALLDEFRSNPDSSLFALSSFWEGVDMPGDTLRLVIITKLPFPGVSDPVAKARRDYLDAQDGRGFISYDLPSAVLKLKQGIGRLIRTEEDRGIVMILDSRILTKAYSRLMIRSLPQGSFPEDLRVESMPRRIESFLY